MKTPLSRTKNVPTKDFKRLFNIIWVKGLHSVKCNSTVVDCLTSINMALKMVTRYALKDTVFILLVFTEITQLLEKMIDIFFCTRIL